MLNDSLYSVEQSKALAEMATKYETEKKEQIIKQQKADLRIQRLIGFSVLSVLLLIGLVVYYRIYQRRKIRTPNPTITNSAKNTERTRTHFERFAR